MRFVLRILVSLLFGSACALVLGLWALSYFQFVRVTTPFRGQSLVLISYEGRMSAVTTPVSMSGVWWERGHVHPELSTYPDQFWPRESVLGFGWMRDTQ